MKRHDGATAIEFAFLAIPFFLIIIGTIELSLMAASAYVLQGAVSDAARLVRTGQIQQAQADPEGMFFEALCDHASVLLNCDNLQYSVEPLDSFANAAQPDIDEDGNLQDAVFNPGGSKEVVLIRAAYRYSLMTPVIGSIFSDYSGNIRLLLSTIVLETEPYEF
ncbi:MAG: pilus assembly protein [Alphaproteobacteria bacterium]|nr:pilus assembly protein [Alphaproteobacteria bacterium]